MRNGILVALALVFTFACAGSTEQAPTAGDRSTAQAPAPVPPGGRIVTAGRFAFPSGVSGTTGTALEQVDEVAAKAHALLGREGLGIGNMLQHTIYLKDGAAPPLAVIQRFHAAATRLAPGLKERPSVGAIVRVPEMADPTALVMVDLIAGIPPPGSSSDDFQRIRFTFGSQDIAETIRVDHLVLTAGLEARDFEHGTLPEGLDGQIDAIVDKLDTAAKHAGLSLAHMVSHNLYVQTGTSPTDVIQKFHAALRRHTDSLVKYPSAGTIVLVDGMANQGFLLEMDAVFATGAPDRYARVPLTEVTMDVVRSVAADNLVFLSSMPGIDFENGSATPADVMQQVEIAAKNVQHTLEKSGLSMADAVKVRLFLKKGAGDPAQVRQAFARAAARYAPALANAPIPETMAIVEGLATPQRLFEASVIAARR